MAGLSSFYRNESQNVTRINLVDVWIYSQNNITTTTHTLDQPTLHLHKLYKQSSLGNYYTNPKWIKCNKSTIIVSQPQPPTRMPQNLIVHFIFLLKRIKVNNRGHLVSLALSTDMTLDSFNAPFVGGGALQVNLLTSSPNRQIKFPKELLFDQYSRLYCPPDWIN